MIPWWQVGAGWGQQPWAPQSPMTGGWMTPYGSQGWGNMPNMGMFAQAAQQPLGQMQQPQMQHPMQGMPQLPIQHQNYLATIMQALQAQPQQQTAIPNPMTWQPQQTQGAPMPQAQQPSIASLGQLMAPPPAAAAPAAAASAPAAEPLPVPAFYETGRQE